MGGIVRLGGVHQNTKRNLLLPVGGAVTDYLQVAVFQVSYQT